MRWIYLFQGFCKVCILFQSKLIKYITSTEKKTSKEKMTNALLFGFDLFKTLLRYGYGMFRNPLLRHSPLLSDRQECQTQSCMFVITENQLIVLIVGVTSHLTTADIKTADCYYLSCWKLITCGRFRFCNQNRSTAALNSAAKNTLGKYKHYGTFKLFKVVILWAFFRNILKYELVFVP